jgi:hypothetical protein
VHTNDTQRAVFTLTVSGPVQRFARVTPQRLVLRGKAGSELVGTVQIIPEQNPFRVLYTDARSGKYFSYRLETIESEGTGGYRLEVTNQKNDPGRYFDVVTLHTDSEVKPQIVIAVYGLIEP